MAAVTMMKRYRKVVAGLLALGMMLTAGAAEANLLTIDYAQGGNPPDISVNQSSGETNGWFLSDWDAVSILHAVNTYADILDPNDSLQAGKFFLNQEGNFTVSGAVTIGANSYTGELLSGHVTNMGDDGNGAYNFLFTATAGSLKGMYGNGGAILLDTSYGVADIIAAPVPEPATMSLLLSGCGALAALRRRQRQ